MAKLQVEKRNGLFDLKPLYEWMRNALDGIYRIEVKKVRKPRSLDQNGWLFGCIYPILLDALLEAGWEFVSVEQVHEFFKAQMTADKVVNKHTGEIVEFPCSTATMDTVTFSTYCEKLREYAKEFLNVDIPTRINIGEAMKRIPNSVVSELIRLVPILIANIPPGQSTRVDNAIRLTKKIINKLKTLKDESRN